MLHSIDPIKGSAMMDVYFRSMWQDKRLQHNATSKAQFAVDANWVKAQIWHPDFHWKEALSAKVVRWCAQYPCVDLQLTTCCLQNNGLVEVDNDGSVFQSSSMTFEVKVAMDFLKLPFDSHTIQLTVESYSQENVEIVFRHPGGNGLNVEQWDSAENKQGQWTLQGVAAMEGVQSFNLSAGVVDYSYAQIQIKFKRISTAYIWTAIIPSVMFSLISYVSFYIDPAAAPARVAMTMICTLTSMASISRVASSVPPLGYLSWLSTYLYGTFFFSVVSVLCFGIVHNARRVAEASKKKQAAAAAATAAAAAALPQPPVLLSELSSVLQHRFEGTSSDGTDADAKIDVATSVLRHRKDGTASAGNEARASAGKEWSPADIDHTHHINENHIAEHIHGVGLRLDKYMQRIYIMALIVFNLVMFGKVLSWGEE
jgi:hypothetical protein